MHRGFSIRGSSRLSGRPKATEKQREREAAEQKSKLERIQNELDGWREARAKDERAYRGVIREAATADPSGGSGETYRAMHVQCDRVWAERIQLKKAELAALSVASVADAAGVPVAKEK